MVEGSLAGREATWIYGGAGHLRERTIEFGPAVIALDNIATMHVTDPGRSYMAAIAGAFMILLGFWVMTMDYLVFAVPLFVAGLALIVWNFVNRARFWLEIGTSDGRRTRIVSKNREFLVSVRDLIREKIDTKNIHMTGAINIAAARFEANKPAAGA